MGFFSDLFSRAGRVARDDSDEDRGRDHAEHELGSDSHDGSDSPTPCHVRASTGLSG